MRVCMCLCVCVCIHDVCVLASLEARSQPDQTLVCLQGDWGGQRTLQKKWTTFLKARLVCSVPDYELHLNMLRAVSVRQGADAGGSTLYGAFGLEW